MRKPIRNVSNPASYIPYKNSRGSWVWRHPDILEDPRWPGIKAPAWATGVVFDAESNHWCWTDECGETNK